MLRRLFFHQREANLSDMCFVHKAGVPKLFWRMFFLHREGTHSFATHIFHGGGSNFSDTCFCSYGGSQIDPTNDLEGESPNFSDNYFFIKWGGTHFSRHLFLS